MNAITRYSDLIALTPDLRKAIGGTIRLMESTIANYPPTHIVTMPYFNCRLCNA